MKNLSKLFKRFLPRYVKIENKEVVVEKSRFEKDIKLSIAKLKKLKDEEGVKLHEEMLKQLDAEIAGFAKFKEYELEKMIGDQKEAEEKKKK